MTPVFQTIVDSVRGDCERACVASILDLPIEEVPNFRDPGIAWDDLLPHWAQRHGYAIIAPKLDRSPDDYNWAAMGGVVALASVPSQKFEGGNHAVIVGWVPDEEHPDALQVVVLHDPNPDNAPYEGVAEQIQRIRFFVPVAP